MFQGHFPNQEIYHEPPLAIAEGRKAAHELRELVADLLGVAGGGLDDGDLIFDLPQALLNLALLLGQAIHLAVDESDRLGGQPGAGEPAGELFPLAADPFYLRQHPLSAGLQLRQAPGAVVLGELLDQGGDHFAPLGQLADLLNDAGLQDVSPDVLLLAAMVVAVVVAHVVLEIGRAHV